MAQEHRSCPDSQIVSVPDMIGTLFNLSESKKTQSCLQQMINVMTSLNESKQSRLKSLKEAKNEAMNMIDEFENALKAILHKAVEKSRMKLEEEFMKIEKSLLQEIRSVDDTNAELKKTDDKLTKAAANKAQRFVCSKEAEKNIKVAENEKMTQETNDKKDPSIKFHPNQAIMENIQGLHGIGDVMVAKKRSDGYKVKSSTDINIRVSNDTLTCCCFGCCLTPDNQLLVTDWTNKKLKRIDTSTLTVTDSCVIDGHPGAICCINKQEVVVACQIPNKIQFISIVSKMKPSRKIDISHICCGIALNDDHLYVTDYNTSLYVYDMNGTVLRTIIPMDNDGNKLFFDVRHIAFNENGNKMFVADLNKGLVCFDKKCNHLYTIKDTDLNGVIGVCTDGKDSLFVTGLRSKNVVQFNEDGRKISVVVKQEDGLNKPCSVAFHHGQNRIYVTMEHSNIMKMYE